MAYIAIPFLLLKEMDRHTKDEVEYSSAICCVASAIAIGICSIVVSEHHDIAAGVLIFVAQLLIFAASVFHLNYKLGSYGQTDNDNKHGDKE